MRALLIAVPLAACAVEPLPPTAPAQPVPPPPPAAAECKADPGQRFVGQQAQPSTPEAARIATGARTVRVIRPGDAVTMDFRTDRLNVEVGANGIVTRVSCG